MYIGRNILRMREKQGMNQTQLAKEVNIKRNCGKFTNVVSVPGRIRRPANQIVQGHVEVVGQGDEDIKGSRIIFGVF